MTLPSHEQLSISKLSGVFNDTTASYKYLWFIAILYSIRKEQSSRIDILNVVIEMIAFVWYPTNFFRVSFGKQDKLAEKVAVLCKELRITADIKKDDLLGLLKSEKKNKIIKEIVKDLTRYVPYRFLHPWFKEILKEAGISSASNDAYIAKLADKYFNSSEIKPVYRVLDRRTIEIDQDWYEYFQSHLLILESFALWHFILYLQNHNPNLPNLPQKLFEPIQRDLKDARLFWLQYFKQTPELRCLYSGAQLAESDFSIDHFIPWSFVYHDQLWNLIPISKSVNSSKGDNIPSIEYLDTFTKTQYAAMHFHLEKKKQNKRIGFWRTIQIFLKKRLKR